MYIVERHPPRPVDHVQRAIMADPSARFIYDLATSAPAMSLASLRAASDLVDRASEAAFSEAPVVRRLGAARRLRLVASREPLAI